MTDHADTIRRYCNTSYDLMPAVRATNVRVYGDWA